MREAEDLLGRIVDGRSARIDQSISAVVRLLARFARARFTSEPIKLLGHFHEKRRFRQTNIRQRFSSAAFGRFLEAHLRHRCLPTNEEALPIGVQAAWQGLWSFHGSAGVSGVAGDPFNADDRTMGKEAWLTGP